MQRRSKHEGHLACLRCLIYLQNKFANQFSMEVVLQLKYREEKRKGREEKSRESFPCTGIVYKNENGILWN